MSNLEKREAALEAADHLVTAMENNTNALQRVSRRQRAIWAVLAMFAATLFSVVKVNYDGAVSRCETGNELRAEIDDRFQSATDGLRRLGVGDTADQNAFLIVLSTDLEPRDCDDINWLGQ